MANFELTNEGYAIIPSDTHIGKWVKENKRLDFDQNAIPLIMEFIKDTDCVIDCGANIGAYSFAFLQKADFVVSFESNLEAFECLKYNLKYFPNSHIYNYALGSIAGKVDIVKDVNAGASHCVLSPTGEIEVRTIDSYKIEKVDFIKIDCEGFELEILKGAIKTIQRNKPKMYIEINEGALNRMGATAKDIFDFLDLFHYQYRNIYEKQPMEGAQYDIICW